MSKHLGTLAIVLQDKKITEEFVEIYHKSLEDVHDILLHEAFKRCLLECRFYPTIAEIRKYAKEAKEEIVLKPSYLNKAKEESAKRIAAMEESARKEVDENGNAKNLEKHRHPETS